MCSFSIFFFFILHLSKMAITQGDRPEGNNVKVGQDTLTIQKVTNL